MGKYMKKCRAAAAGNDTAPAAVEVRAQVVVGGVRTRSRSAAFARGATAQAPKRRKQATTARLEEALGRDGAAPTRCYLQLRSRRLFMAAAAAVVAPRGRVPEEPAVSGASSGDAVVGGISCCSSTALSVDVAGTRERSGGEAEACEGRDAESSVSDSGCGGRERRETTPSSRTPVDLSDHESSYAADERKHQRRRSPVTTTAAATFHAAARARMPAPAEIEEFFAAAEKAETERFAAKYNFDVARGVPLNTGRFEWTPVASG